LDNNVVIAIQTNWLSIVLGLAVIIALHFLARKRIGFGSRVLIALGLGLVAGIVLNAAQAGYDAIQLIGSIYVNLIRMVVIPLVFVLVINSIISITDTGYLKKIGVKTIGWFLLTTGIAAIIGLLSALALNPGAGIDARTPEDFQAREVPTLFQVILDQVPNNPISDAANGKVVPVLIFALFIAFATVKLGEKKPDTVQPFKAFIQSVTEIMHQVVRFVLRFTPYGVFALIAVMAARYGLDTLKPLARLIGVSYFSLRPRVRRFGAAGGQGESGQVFQKSVPDHCRRLYDAEQLRHLAGQPGSHHETSARLAARRQLRRPARRDDELQRLRRDLAGDRRRVCGQYFQH